MISVHHFWRRIESAGEDGVLLLVLFKSWRRIADYVGFDGVDIASGFFDALCHWATEGIWRRADSPPMCSAPTGQPLLVVLKKRGKDWRRGFR